MRVGLANLTAIALVLGLCPSTYSQQARRAGDKAIARTKTFNTRPSFRGAAGRSRGRLGTFASDRYGGMRTRAEQLEEMIEASRGSIRQSRERQLSHPVRDLLESRNLLSPRSSLGNLTVSSLGRNLVLDDNEPTDAISSATLYSLTNAPTETVIEDHGPYVDTLSSQIDQKADESYALGLQRFRAGDYIQARGYFEMAGDIRDDQPRPHLAIFLAAHMNADEYQAYNRLTLAIKRANTLDELRIDPNAFFKDPSEFKRTLENVNIWAKSQSTAAAPNLILAYFTWLNGDQTTALAAVDVTITSASYPGQAEVGQKFRDLLTSKTPVKP